GAEIVDRQAAAERAQLAGHRDRPALVADERALGELEGEPGRLDSPDRELLRDELGQRRLAEGDRRQVERERDVESLLLPLRRMPQRGVHRETRQREDQAAL